MRSLFPLLAGLEFGISALPATAAPKPEDRTSGPALVGQARSWSDMLAMIREGAKTIGGDKLADAFDKEVLSSISPAILPAIDPDKPFGLYALAGAEPQLCRLVFLAPVRNSSDFLKQLADFGIKTEKTEGDATFQIESPLPIPVHLKFNEGYACISLGGADALTGKKLLAPKDVINPKEKSPAVLTLHMERIPDGLKKFVTANAADAAEQYRELFPVGDYRETFQLVTSMGLRWLRQLTEQAREISLRLDADPKTTDLKLELAITPIPKTALADAIAARPANTNAFAGLVTKDSVQWMLLSAPMFHEDLREALVKLAAIGRQAAVEQVTQFGTPETLALTESAFKSLGATLKSGSMDLAMVVRGPNAKGHYTAVGAVQLLETADLEKACREALKTAPEPVRKAVKLDAGKLGELNLHEITISDAPEELKNFSRGEEDLLEKQIKSIVDTGAKLVVCGGKVGDMALHFLNKYNIMVVRVLSKFDLRRIAKTVNGTVLAKVQPPTPEEMGYCEEVYVDEVGDVPVISFNQSNNQGAISTIIVRGSTDNIMDDIERSIDDGVNNFKALTKDGRLLAGAGAVEIELAKQLTTLSESYPGLEQYAIKKFAEAFEVIPKTLAENSGFKNTEVLSLLYAAHQEGKATFGFNIEVFKFGILIQIHSKSFSFRILLRIKCNIFILRLTCIVNFLRIRGKIDYF